MKTERSEAEIQHFLHRCDLAVDHQETLNRILCTYLAVGRRKLQSILNGCSNSKSRRFGNVYHYQRADIVSRLYSLLLGGLVLKVGDWWYGAPADFCRVGSYEIEEPEPDDIFHQQQKEKSTNLSSKPPLTPKQPFGIWSKLDYPQCGCEDQDTHDTMHYLLRYAWVKISDLITPSEINEEINKILTAYNLPNAHREEIEALGIQRKLAISKKYIKKLRQNKSDTAEKLAKNN